MSDYVFSEPKIDRYAGSEGPIIRTEIKVTRALNGEPVATLFAHTGDSEPPISDQRAASLARLVIHRMLTKLVEETADWGSLQNPDLSFDGKPI